MAQTSHCSAELIERKDITASLAVFRFLVTQHLAFVAGQFATIGIATDGDLIERPYSIVSSPHERFVEFFIELVPGGSFTPKVVGAETGIYYSGPPPYRGPIHIGPDYQPSLDAGHRHRRSAVCQHSENSTN